MDGPGSATDAGGPAARIGLTSAVAASRFRTDGPNEIAAGQRRTLAAIALGQVASPLVIILIIASLLPPPDAKDIPLLRD